MSCSRRSQRNRIALSVAMGLALLASCRPSGQHETLPNIVFFLVDDMGWVDSSAYGSRYYETPNIERLAARGMLFTDAYSADPLCAPTRASIMSGQNPARPRFLRVRSRSQRIGAPGEGDSAESNHKLIVPHTSTQLPLAIVTIAEALKPRGYHTAFIGKWHLGDWRHSPQKQGFDAQIGGSNTPAPASYFSPYQTENLPPGPDGEYLTDRLTDEAIAYIADDGHQPFMLHLWHYGLHGPWGAKEEITEKYRDRRDPRGRQGNPVMASMIHSIDESLGRILDALGAHGLAENTVVIFTSDNGGNTHTRIAGRVATSNAPLRGGKGDVYEGGVRVPLIVSWPGIVEPGSRSSEIVQSVDFYPTLLEMTGTAPPEGQVLDGVSFAPALLGEPAAPRAIYFYSLRHGPRSGPAAAVRRGDFKLIRFLGDGPNLEDRDELYDLADDIGETRNLVDQAPARAQALGALLEEFLVDTEALTALPNPDHDPSLPEPVFSYRDHPGQTRASEAERKREAVRR